MEALKQTSYSRFITIVMVICGLMGFLMSCDEDCDDQTCDLVDSLNMQAYYTRYVNLDTTNLYSVKAYELSEAYPEGRAVALLNLAFVQYMLMDYDSSRVLYLQSHELSKSAITKAVADVGLMKICQITGRNDKFYDYHIDANKHMARLEEEVYEYTPLQTTFYNYAKSEFHMASATYYNNIQLHDLAQAEMNSIAEDMSMVNTDMAQLARYYVLSGEYELAHEIGMRCNLKYMMASSSQRIADMMINYHDQAYGDSISPFALFMAQDALHLFRDYGSLYSRAITYLTISDYYASRGEYEVALDTATKALEFVNIQQKGIYGNDIDFITPFPIGKDKEAVELEWLKNKTNSCAWEWIATIRGHLSELFSEMGMNSASDYNARICWEIHNATRKDKRLERQIEILKQEQSDQTAIAWVLVVLVLLTFVGIYVYIRFLRRNAEKSYEKELADADSIFKNWMATNEVLYNSMNEEEKKLDSETYIHEQHIIENKRSYIYKCTSLSLVYSITPFLDRAINELNKLKTAKESEDVKCERVGYLTELIDRINLYNEVLAHWIKVRQGIVTLNIENFEVQPLLDTLAKNRNSFANKGLTLNVHESAAVVKADKALTLFMMNTLLDNARKYTPEGGEVSVNVTDTDEYVEISVKDTGRGLSEQDITTICEEKVYDSSRIGDVEHDQDLKKNKGFGFGLMNCKGIIDKYRKTNQIFSVCQFNIESKIGEGSRFYFRLPKGIMKTMMLIFMLLFTVMPSKAQQTQDEEYLRQHQLELQTEYESLKEANATRQTFVFIAVGLLITAFVFFVVVYYRLHLLHTFNLRQLMQFSRKLFETPDADLLSMVYDGVNDIKPVDGIALGIYQNEESKLQVEYSNGCPMLDAVDTVLHHSFSIAKEINVNEGRLRAYPLILENTSADEDDEQPETIVGCLAVVFHTGTFVEDDENIIRILTQHLAKFIYYSQTKVESQKVEIQLKDDIRLRAEKEENSIHIQNMVLDNCLSAIKHETMYYPNRIKQLLDDSKHAALDSENTSGLDDKKVETLHELITYYKDVFTVLSQCAARQLDNVMFKRKSIPVSSLAQYASKAMKRLSKKYDADVEFAVQKDSDLKVSGDRYMLEYLIDNLLTVAVQGQNEDGKVTMSFDKYEEFVRITFVDERSQMTEDELLHLFYPEHLKYDEDEDRLIGVEFMVCRQIIREHDEYGGRRGCRINATKLDQGYRMEVMLNRG